MAINEKALNLAIAELWSEGELAAESAQFLRVAVRHPIKYALHFFFIPSFMQKKSTLLWKGFSFLKLVLPIHLKHNLFLQEMRKGS